MFGYQSEFCISSFSEVEFLRLRRALMVPDAGTAGDSPPQLCVDRACPGSMVLFHAWLLDWNTRSVCGLGLKHLHEQSIGGVTSACKLFCLTMHC